MGGVLLAACAGAMPEISGDFGSVPAPDQTQFAELGLQGGDTVIARKLQQDGDTVFAHLFDYGIRPVPEDSIAWIRIRSRNDPELRARQHAEIREAGKEVAATAAANYAPLLILMLPAFLLIWFLKSL